MPASSDLVVVGAGIVGLAIAAEAVRRRPGGVAWAGPTAVLALSREGYRLREVRPADLWESLTFPGFWRLLRRHRRAQVEEAALEMLPALLARHLDRDPPVMHVRNAPSPAATSSLALARWVVDQADENRRRSE